MYYSEGVNKFIARELNFTKAREWYQKVANQGYAPAQCALGIMYRNGEGVDQDFTKARKWFAMAAWRDGQAYKQLLELENQSTPSFR